MNALAIRDFSADFSVDFTRDTIAPKTNDAPRDLDRSGDIQDRESNFDRALKDEVRDRPRNEAPQRRDERVLTRDDPREQAQGGDALETEDAQASEPASKPDQGAETRAPRVTDKSAAKQQDKTHAHEPAHTFTAETPTAVVTASKAATSIASMAPEADAAAAAGEGDKASAQAFCGLTVSAASGADAMTPQPQANAQNTAQANIQDAALAALLAPQQATPQKSGATTDAAPSQSAPSEPDLLGALKAAAAPGNTGSVETQANSADAGASAPAGGFETALAKQAATAAPALKKGESAETQTPPAQAPAAAPTANPQTNAAQAIAKPQDAAAGKDGQAAAGPEIKADAPQQAQAAAPVHAAQRAEEHRATASPTAHASANASAVAQNVVRFFRNPEGGAARFEIRLDPVELGRVDARVELNPDKTVSLTLSADRPETLQELMRSARDLERQLTDSGVKLSDDGVKFRLNADAQSGQGWRDAQNQSGAQARPSRGYGETEQDVSAPIVIKSWRAGGVEVWA